MVTTVSSLDLLEGFAAAVRCGQLRRHMSKTADEFFLKIGSDVRARATDVENGMSRTGAQRRAAWDAVLKSTSVLASAHELIGQLQSLNYRADALLPDTSTSARLLIDLADREFPEQLVGAQLRVGLEALRGRETDPDRLARTLLGLGYPDRVPSLLSSVTSVTRLRFVALHARVLGQIADTTPKANAATAAERDSLADDVNARANAVRNASRDAANELRARDKATPASALAMWSALYEFETWLIKDGAAAVANLTSAATSRVQSNAPDAERWAREAGKAYDAVRSGLAFDSGVRAVLRAYSGHDAKALKAFGKLADLPIGSVTLDPARSSLADVANAAAGDGIEIDGLVRGAEFRVGGPSNRSVLSLGKTHSVRVLVPHVAVDSFGVNEGVWVQVRGNAYPDGKDGIAGPLVMVGRIPRGQAAQGSFTDALIHAGRGAFQLRPASLDLVAGRLAGDAATMSEIGRLV